MSATIRGAYSNWPRYNSELVKVVATLDDTTLAVQPAADRWPLWATIGHAACQRVFWLCDVAGAPRVEGTPFPDAGNNCPGDDDLEHVLRARQLVDALNSTFSVVETCLDSWTLDSLAEEIGHPEWSGDWHPYTRGSVIQRVFAHDISHIAELNEALGRLGLIQVDLWD